MKENLERHLLQVLERLEKASIRIQSTSGYTGQTRRLRMVTELVKEQIRHEDTRHSARAVR